MLRRVGSVEFESVRRTAVFGDSGETVRPVTRDSVLREEFYCQMFE